MPETPPKVRPVSNMARDIWDENHPEVLRLKHHYERLGMHEWNNDRVSALAQRMNLTIWALCATAGAFTPVYDRTRDLVRLDLDKALIQRCWKANSWPVPLVVGFHRLENFLDRCKRPKNRDTIVSESDRVLAKALARNTSW